MIKIINIIFYFFLFLLLITFSFKHSAEEILMYADEIIYDAQNNIIGKGNVKIISEFGATACKAMYKCLNCLEPFEFFKCI